MILAHDIGTTGNKASLHDDSGRIVAGTLKSEDANQVTLETPEGKSISVPLKEIDERTPPKSAMPPMGKVLTPRELRDVIEFLATIPNSISIPI